MKRELHPAKQIGGELEVPGDKSIGQRAALLSLLTTGTLSVRNFPNAVDPNSALEAVRLFGVQIEEVDGEVIFTPPEKWHIEHEAVINCGNSGTTARLLAGIVAGSSHNVILAGDESLSTRPMSRIATPLREMGAEVYDTDGHLPMKVYGRKLLPFEYTLPVPSAQLKSSILLAGLSAGCSVTVREITPSRDHTERMLAELGASIEVEDIKPVLEEDPHDPRKKRQVMPADYKREIRLAANASLSGGTIDVPGDISTASYFFGLAAVSGATVTVRNVGLNPTRTEILSYLKAIGCDVKIADKHTVSGEPRGSVTVTGRALKSRRISGDTIVGLIDEIPIVAVMAAFAEGTTVIRDAGELRVKESDRLEAIAENLNRMGVSCGLLDDGLAIEGGKEFSGADFSSFGDHRVAMAFSIASMMLVGPSTIDNDEVVSISCPPFYDLLHSVAQ